MIDTNIEIWNIRGLNDVGKVTAVNEMLCKLKPDIICLSETKKRDFSPSYLKEIENFHDFEWNWLSAFGTAGGILVGINVGMFEIFSWYKR
jgi:exonuclease III